MPPKPVMKEERPRQIGFKPYEMSPRQSEKTTTSCYPANKLPAISQMSFHPYFGMLPSPALISPFTTSMPEVDPSNLLSQALLQRFMFNYPSQAPMFPFPPLFKPQVVTNKSATVKSIRKSSPPPKPQSQQKALDLSLSISSISTPAAPSASPTPIVVEPRLSPGRSSSGASSPDSGVCSGNVSHLNDSSPLDLSSSCS